MKNQIVNAASALLDLKQFPVINNWPTVAGLAILATVTVSCYAMGCGYEFHAKGSYGDYSGEINLVPPHTDGEEEPDF